VAAVPNETFFKAMLPKWPCLRNGAKTVETQSLSMIQSHCRRLPRLRTKIARAQGPRSRKGRKIVAEL